MTETILELFAAVLILAVLRAVLGIVGKGVSDFYRSATGASSAGSNPSSGGRPVPRPPSQASPEALKKDPVCGTYVAPSTALRATVNGETYYFCSPECQQKFKA